MPAIKQAPVGQTPIWQAAVWQPRGRGFSMAAVDPADGHVIRFTGQVAWDENETIIGPGDIRAQTRQCFHNIEILLESVGGELGDIVEIITYFTDRTQLPIIQDVRLEFISKDCPPVSTSIMVAGLGHVDFLVELTPVAIVPANRFKPPCTVGSTTA
jgi:enamine deaminase RidA (YjgF/YER057c/UK114 family)